MALKHPPSARLAKANLTATHGPPAYVAVVARHGARWVGEGRGRITSSPLPPTHPHLPPLSSISPLPPN
jgi:hypothetical protein